MADWATIAYGAAILVYGVIWVAMLVWVIDGVIRRFRKGGRTNG
jgi:hypothetical protein